MALPTTKNEFINYCLRQLGHPVIQINLSPEQIEDAYDEAVRYWNEHHMDGTEKSYVVIPIDNAFQSTRQTQLPDGVYSVSEMYGLPQGSSASPLFDVEYHLTSDALWAMMRGDGSGLLDYYLTKSWLAEMRFNLEGIPGFDYNYHTRTFRVNSDSWKLNPGSALLLEVMTFIDPEQHPSVFRDTWLINYTCALIKYRWGNTMKKFSGVQLPGGVTLNGQEIFMESTQEKERLELECENRYNLPLGLWIG